MDRCVRCGKEVLPLSRTIHPLSTGCSGVRAFFIQFVKPSFVFPGPGNGKSLFVYKKPCFTKLEQGMSKVSAVENIIRELHTVPDGIFGYACAVLNDGLLLLEFRDAIHEGDGERIVRCWKLLMLYFRVAGHTKYALEAFPFLAKVNEVASPRLQQQFLWSRVVNSKGGSGKNIPVDLYMEHLNHLLKGIIIGLGANISESSIVNASTLNAIVSLSESFDEQLGIHRASIHHTTKSSNKDREVVLKQLSSESNVFEYTPGRKHYGFKNISPNVAQSIHADALFMWINKHKKKLAKQLKFEVIWSTTVVYAS